MEFNIIAPGAGEIQLTNNLPSSFTGILLPGANNIIAEAHFGKMIFQHYQGQGFDIWFSNYLIDHNTEIIGRADIPVLELHIQFRNQFDIIWDGAGKNTLKPYQYNITYTPFVHNKAKFISCRDYHTFDIHFSMDYLQHWAPSSAALSGFLEKVATKQPTHISEIDRFLSPAMITIVNQMLQSNFNNGLNHFYIDCKITELLTLILDHITGKHPLTPLKLSNYDMEKLYEAKAILLSDFEADISLAKLSRKIALNEYKLKKGFKYLFGTTVFGYRHIARMEQAKEMILNTNIPIADIAFMTGFEHPSNFQKAFKQHFKFTPAELKKFNSR